MTKPEKAEYDAYYERYVSLVDESSLLESLVAQPGELSDLLGNLPDERGAFAYDEDKWTIKELLGHLIDGERFFAYRILRISRGDTTPIEGFEQDGYIENARSNARSIVDLIEEFRLLREANMFLLKNLNEEDWLRMGTASGLPVSVRALAYIMSGHITHHVNILQTRYLA
jgi:DinB superfamily